MGKTLPPRLVPPGQRPAAESLAKRHGDTLDKAVRLLDLAARQDSQVPVSAESAIDRHSRAEAEREYDAWLRGEVYVYRPMELDYGARKTT